MRNSVLYIILATIFGGMSCSDSDEATPVVDTTSVEATCPTQWYEGLGARLDKPQVEYTNVVYSTVARHIGEHEAPDCYIENFKVEYLSEFGTKVAEADADAYGNEVAYRLFDDRGNLIFEGEHQWTADGYIPKRLKYWKYNEAGHLTDFRENTPIIDFDESGAIGYNLFVSHDFPTYTNYQGFIDSGILQEGRGFDECWHNIYRTYEEIELPKLDDPDFDSKAGCEIYVYHHTDEGYEMFQGWYSALYDTWLSTKYTTYTKGLQKAEERYFLLNALASGKDVNRVTTYSYNQFDKLFRIEVDDDNDGLPDDITEYEYQGNLEIERSLRPDGKPRYRKQTERNEHGQIISVEEYDDLDRPDRRFTYKYDQALGHKIYEAEFERDGEMFSDVPLHFHEWVYESVTNFLISELTVSYNPEATKLDVFRADLYERVEKFSDYNQLGAVVEEFFDEERGNPDNPRRSSYRHVYRYYPEE